MSDRATVIAALRHEQQTLADRLQHLSVVDKVLQVIQTDAELATVREWIAGLAPVTGPAVDPAFVTAYNALSSSDAATLVDRQARSKQEAREVAVPAPPTATDAPPPSPPRAPRAATKPPAAADPLPGTHGPILALLRKAGRDGMSAKEIGNALGRPGGKAWNSLRSLRERGFVRQARPRGPWTLVERAPAPATHPVDEEFEIVPLPRASDLTRSTLGGGSFALR